MKYIVLLGCCFTFVFAQLQTTVSILPQKFFVQKIGGDKVDVSVMVQPGSSPATYDPSAKQMQRLTNSDIYFAMDVPFEKRWLHRFKDVAKDTTFVAISQGIEKRAIKQHSHGDLHDHAHHDTDQSLDPHIWLSPKRVVDIAKNIYETLVQHDADNRDYYKQNYEMFVQEIQDLDAKIVANLSDLSSRKFIVFHPSWGYFADDYDLIQVAIEDQGKKPKQKDLIQLIEFAKKEGIKAVFVSAEFSQKSAQTIAKNIGGATITISPLSPKWDENLLRMSQKLQEVLQ
ncbi:MAG: metal ABC transporter solute-binding protein, Zn/Mn family [Campylobacterota bacterium]